MLEWIFTLDGIKYEWPRTKEEIEEWIDKGYYINAKNECDETICMEVAANGYTDILQRVSKSAYLDAQNNLGWTACMLAAARGHTDAVVILAQSGAALDIKNKNGRTACIIAARNGHTDVVKTLAKFGAGIYIKDDEGKIVLDYIEDEKVKQEIISASKEYARNCDQDYKVCAEVQNVVEPRKVATQGAQIPEEELWKNFGRDSR